MSFSVRSTGTDPQSRLNPGRRSDRPVEALVPWPSRLGCSLLGLSGNRLVQGQQLGQEVLVFAEAVGSQDGSIELIVEIPQRVAARVSPRPLGYRPPPGSLLCISVDPKLVVSP